MLPAEAQHRPGPARPAARSLIRLAAAGLAAAALAGCGDDSPDATAGGSSVSLELTLDADGPGGAKPRTESISCEPGSGCAGGPAALSPEDFQPTPPATACTEIFGGPDTATVEGTLDGARVSAELTRANGCEIERFDRFAPLLEASFPGYQPGAEIRP